MKVPNKPVNQEAETERRATREQLGKAVFGENWGAVEDAGLGRIRRSHGSYRIEGCRSGGYAVLYHDDRVIEPDLPLQKAIVFCESAEKQRLADQKAHNDKVKAEAAAKAAAIAKSPDVLVEVKGAEGAEYETAPSAKAPKAKKAKAE